MRRTLLVSLLSASSSAGLASCAVQSTRVRTDVTTAGPIADSTADSTTERRVCFRGRPLPRCRRYWVTEMGYSRRLTSSASRGGEGAWYVTAELGHAWNLDTRHALGGTLFFGFDDDGSRWGLRPRVRRVITGGLAVELAPGVLLAGSDRVEPRFPGFSGQVSVDFGNLFAVTTQLEVLRRQGAPTRVEWFGGVRGGSYLGIIVIPAVAILALIAVSTIRFGG